MRIGSLTMVPFFEVDRCVTFSKLELLARGSSNSFHLRPRSHYKQFFPQLLLEICLKELAFFLSNAIFGVWYSSLVPCILRRFFEIISDWQRATPAQRADIRTRRAIQEVAKLNSRHKFIAQLQRSFLQLFKFQLIRWFFLLFQYLICNLTGSN